MVLSYFLCLSLLYSLILFLTHLPYRNIAPKPATRGGWCFYISALLSQMFLYAVLLAAVNALIYWLVPNKVLAVVIAALLFALLWLLLLGNAQTYARYRFNINLAILKLSFGKGATEVVQPSMSELLLFIIAISLIMIFSAGGEWLGYELANINGAQYFVAMLFWMLAVMYIVNQLFCLILLGKGKMSLLQYAIKVFGYMRLSWSYAWLLRKRWEDGSVQALMQQMTQIEQKQDFNYPRVPVIRAATAVTVPNILVICIDSWRFDMLNAINTPHIQHFATQSQYFDNHWSNGNTTQPGIFSLFYGLPPNYWQASLTTQTPPLWLAELKRDQYQFAIYASANLINPPFMQNVFYGLNHVPTFTTGADPYERDQTITAQMNQFLKSHSNNRPFFGFLFYDAAHGYYASKNLPQKFTPTTNMNHITIGANTNPEPLFNQYKNALFAIDAMVGSVLARLRQQNLLDSTYVVITSDHGQEFNDLNKNYWEHPSNFAQYQTKVPLVMHWPGKSPQQWQHRTSHCDIAATLMPRLLGITNPLSEYTLGKDLFSVRDTTAMLSANYTNYALMYPEFVINFDKTGLYQVYDSEMNLMPTPLVDVLNIQNTLHNQCLFQ